MSSRRIIAGWLSIVCITVFVMVVVGGVTRLTHSGLSMVDWDPIMGVVPPLNTTDWEAAFEAYKQYPEYQKVNRGMDLDGFKGIFYWEYGHRVLGRIIGLIFFVPFVVLLAFGKIRGALVPKLIIALVLGGLQGLMGWYMVMSGLVDMPRVSHYRLAAHLLLALVILGYIFWLILGLFASERRADLAPPWLKQWSVWVLVLVFLQITYGAFVSGLRAGFGYNTFPKMGDVWIAEAVFVLSPWWHNLFESGATIQLIHRWLGTLIVVLVGLFWLKSLVWLRSLSLPAARVRWAVHGLALSVVAQFLLGVVTLVMVIPIPLAAAHQGLACIVLVAAIWLIHRCRYVPVV